MTYRSGDFWRICDRTGFKVRASDTVKDWNGLIVKRSEWDGRHPQDFVKAKMDRQRVPDPQPEGNDVFLSDVGGTPIGLLLALTTASRNLG